MKKITRLLFLLAGIFAIQSGFSQDIAIVGYNGSTGDGITIVATTAIAPGTVYYFTDREYSDAGNAFNTGEGVWTYTAPAAGLSAGDVITFTETGTSTNVLSLACSMGGSCGSFALVSGTISLASTSAEHVYAYTDSDGLPENGVTTIHSVLLSRGNLTADENPSADFPGAIVVDGFPVSGDHRDFMDALRAGTVSQALIENPSSYDTGSGNQALSTVAFSDINLAGANPVVTVAVAPASVAEDGATNLVFTFSRTMDATNPLTVNFNVGGSATFSTDYTQSGAASFTAMSGTVTFPGGMSTVDITVDPSVDTDLEPNETIILSVAAGTGYDPGSPDMATGTIDNDDTANITPLVAVVGANHTGTDGFSFVALDDISGGSVLYFTENPFDMGTLSFSGVEAVVSWTAPGAGVSRGEVIVVSETAANTFTTTCNSGTCGTSTIVSGSFSLASDGEGFFAYQDTDADHTNGITQVDAVLYTGAPGNPGGNIPMAQDPTTKYIGSVLVDGFPASMPSLTEYDPSKRGVTVDQANFQNTVNWLNAQPAGTLDTTPFSNIIIATGSANPTVSVAVAPGSVLEDGATNLVYTFTLSEMATSDITVNFTVGGTATFSTDYSVMGSASFDATSGSVVIGNGTSSAQVTVDPTADTDVETQETVEIMIAAGTGYDGGSPNDATGTITNDDTSASMPLVAITGLNHTTADGFSFVAAEDIPAGTTVFFTEDEFDNTSLLFAAGGEAVLQWTSPGSMINKGDVIVATETAPNAFTLSCSDTSGAGCGSLSLISGTFSTATNGETFYAYKDDDTDPTNGVTDIYAVIYTGNAGTPGGNIPAVEDPSGIFLNALVVDGFPATSPDRTEYDPTKRNVPVSMADFENIANWLHAQTNVVLSTVPFTDLAITDDEPPVITCPANVVVSNDAGLCEAAVMLTDPTATDNVSTNFVFVGIRDDGMMLTDPFPVGMTTITWTAEDEAGNVSMSCDQTVTVNDTEDPVAVCADFTVQLDVAGNGSLTAADIDGGSTDNCPGISLSASQTMFTIADIGMTMVELTVTDASGNTASCMANVTVEDNIAPTAICQDITVDLDAAGNASITAMQIDNGSNDASGIASLSVTPDTFTCTDIGVQSVMLTVTDNNGNMASCSANVTVRDQLAPAITCPANVMVMSSDGNPVVVTITPATATDNCDPMPAVTFVRSDNAALDLNDPFPVGTTQIMWTATDSEGNMDMCTQDVTVTFVGSMANDIVSFSVPAQVGMSVIDNTAKTVMAIVPFGTDLTSIAPTIGVSPDAMINPMSGVPQNFSTPVMYTVTAQDGTPQVWTVSVTEDCDVTINTQPQNTEVCEGAVNVDFTVQAMGSGALSYNWQISADGGATFNDVHPSANGNPTLTLLGPLSTVASGNQYRVVVTSDNGTPGTPGDDCSETSDVATLTVNPLPVVTFTAPPDLLIDAGVQAGLGGGSPTGGVYSGPGVTDDGNGMTYSFDPAAAGEGVHTLVYTYTDGNGCTNSASDDIRVIGLASITVVKTVTGVGADPDQQFEFFFNSSISGLLGTFYLSQSGIGSPEVEGGVFNIPGGNLFQFVEQNLPADYDVSDIQFSSANGNSSVTVLNIPGNEIQFIIAEEDDVTITFVNEFTPPIEPLSVTDFVLVNADTNMDIMSIMEGAVIDLSTLPTMNLNIRAEATMDTESVFLDLSGAQSNTRTENVAPYALFGDSSGNYAPHLFALGNYNLMATAYSADGLGGMMGTPASVNFEFINSTIGSPLILVDSSTDTPIMALTEGTVINKSVLGDLLFGVIFDPSLNPNGVSFNLTGPISESRTEGTFPPYSLFGDIGVDIQGMMFPAGMYTLMANPNSGSSVTVNFQVVDVDPACIDFDAFVDDLTDPSTCGGSDGEIQIGVLDFMPPLSFDWSHDMSLNNAEASGLMAGNYTVTVTDANGCMKTLMITLEDPPLPIVTFMAPADLAVTAGVQAGLGGGTPVGGVYSGPGVTDDGNGMTYSFDPAAAGIGVHTLTYSFTDGNGCAGVASDDVEVFDPTVLSVTGFVLVNADSDADIVTLIEGSIIDKSTLATMNLNIRANATADVESVRLELSGAASNGRTENFDPYALFGDLSGDYLPGAFPAGNYTLTATPYSGNGLGGTMGTPMTINFEVIDGVGGMFTLKLYPNPAVTEIAVEMTDTEKEMEIYSIQIHDMQGRLIRSYDSKEVSGSTYYKMPTGSLQSGVYYMTVMGSKGTVQKKSFVVNK